MDSRDEQLSVDELLELAQLSKPDPIAFLDQEVASGEQHLAYVLQSTRYPDSTEHQRILAASRESLRIAQEARERQRVAPRSKP